MSAVVSFAPKKAVLLKPSQGLLHEVAQVMQDRKRICVRVEAHSETLPNKKVSQKLSDDRSAAVKKYLVGKGVAADRLETKGFGDTQPLDKGKKGRVEFSIIACGGGE
jgi:outer membrane protein OmpA-like peptidoglycan-associated protein